LEAVRRVAEGGLSAGEAAMRLSLLRWTWENWLRPTPVSGQNGKSRRETAQLKQLPVCDSGAGTRLK
jgi:hypothetical protein